MTARAGLMHTEVTRAVIGAFFEVYNDLGFGLLESVYAAALQDELLHRGHQVLREQWIDVFYKGRAIARSALT